MSRSSAPRECDLESLSNALSVALNSQHASFILVVGAAGSGKTTVARRAASLTEVPTLHLHHSLFAGSSAGDVEAAVDAFFARAVASAPAVVFVDDIDVIVPSTPSGPADIRALASFSGALDDLNMDPSGSRGLVVLATAVSAHDVHSSFLQDSGFRDVMEVKAPRWKSRRAMAEALLLEYSRDADVESSREADVQAEAEQGTEGCSPCRDGPLDSILDQVASSTPGFLPADLRSVFMEAFLFARRDRLGLANCGSEAVVSGVEGDGACVGCEPRRLLSCAVKCASVVRPSLLRTMGSAWAPVSWREGATKDLFGLAEQISLVRSTAVTSFSEVWREPESGNIPERFKAIDALGPAAGIVIHGPTGSGKTSLARAVPSFLPKGSVNSFTVDTTDIVSKAVGASERRIRELFRVARASAPSIVVLENIEVLAPHRSLLSGYESSGNDSTAAFRRLLSTFLVELDGISTKRSDAQVLLVATSSDISAVDRALLRPGRLEVHVELSYPDHEARLEILEAFCAQAAPHLLASGNVAKRDAEANSGKSVALDDAPPNPTRFPEWMRSLASTSQGWSPAELQAVCYDAGLRAVREAVSAGEASERDKTGGPDKKDAPPCVEIGSRHFVDAMGGMEKCAFG